MNIQQMIARSTFCLLGLIGLALFTSPVTAQVFDNVINIPPDPNIGDFADVGGDGLTTQVNISDGGSIGEGLFALAGSEINISGGIIGDFFSARSGSVVNMSGCTFSFEFEARSGSEVNIFGYDFVLDGAPLNSLAAGNAFTIADRDVTLTGVFVDGTAFSLALNSDLSQGDFISPDATLTVTLVPPPIILGDVNQDGVVTFLDINPFISILSTGGFLEQADCNLDGVVTFLDINPFIQILAGG